MPTYRINVSALKRMAAIEFSHHCNRVRHPELGGPIMKRLRLGAVAQQAAKEHSISAARAMDFIMTAWQAEGQAVINRWDVHAIATLTDAVPTALPNKYRQAAIRSIEQDNGGEWVVCYDSDRPRQTPDRAPKDGFELIVYTRGTATLEVSLMERIAPMVAEHKAHLAKLNQRLTEIDARMPGCHAHETSAVKDMLFQTWMMQDPEHSLGQEKGYLTAQIDDLSLLTRPCRAMIRRTPGAECEEVDGVAYAWLDAQGRIRNWARPGDEEANGEVHQTDFAHFTATVACFVPSGGWAVAQDALAEQEIATDAPAEAQDL